MITRSLRWRLLMGAAAAILAALVVAWLFMAILFERHIERRLRVELTREASRLVAALTITPDGRPSLINPLIDPRLETPAGGYYWQATSAAGVVRSRSLWDQALRPPLDAPADAWRLRRDKGPFDEPVFVLERAIRPTSAGAPVTIQLAEDAAGLASAQSEFGRELALFLAGLWLFLSTAAFVQVRLGLGPLARVREDLAALWADSSARLPKPRLNETKPLTDAINAMADAREAELLKARERASDLAHALRTPIAALAAQSRRVGELGQQDIAAGLDRAIQAITTATDAELARRRVAAARPGKAAIRTVVEEILGVIEQTESGERIVFTNDIPDHVTAPLRHEDLTELIGPLVDNAARFALRRVVITAGDADGAVEMSVSDDGPGIDGHRAAEASTRGVRLDQSGVGYGLGLSITRDLAELSGGTLVLARSDIGGLRASVRWPLKASTTQHAPD